MIDRSMVQQLFDQLRQQGVDPEQTLMWSYFFTDEKSPARLQLAVPKLEELGYKFVSIFVAEPGSEPQVLDGRTYENPPLYALQVQRLEAHTINSLHSRNQKLHEFSEDNDLFSYDGMSVGTATGAPFGAVRESSGNDG
jgi:hypothetical protein